MIKLLAIAFTVLTLVPINAQANPVSQSAQGNGAFEFCILLLLTISIIALFVAAIKYGKAVKGLYGKQGELDQANKLHSEESDQLKSQIAELDKGLSYYKAFYEEYKGIPDAKKQIEQDRQEALSKQRDIESESRVVAARIASEQAKLREILQRQSDAEKKAVSAEKRVARLRTAYESVQYTLDRISHPEQYLTPGALTQDFESLTSIAPVKLNCLDVKSLRGLYRDNEKSIKQIYETFTGRYNTKVNAALYKLMVLAMDAELQNILNSLKYNFIDKAIDNVKALTTKYYTIATEGNQTIAPTIQRFIGQLEYLYIQAVKIEYEYYVKQESIKEEQRAIREQMRQEAAERRQLELDKKKVEAEEAKYQTEIDRLKAELVNAEQTAAAMLEKRIAEVRAQLSAVAEKKEEIIRLQNGKAGTVYVISNVGSFGEDVFKVGMTRRQEYMDRVNELGDASVPFPFDVHAAIFSEDASSLETSLHRELDARRINKINRRKEFFRISTDELREIVERVDPSAAFNVTALAEQYHQSMQVDYVPTGSYDGGDSEDAFDDESDDERKEG